MHWRTLCFRFSPQARILMAYISCKHSAFVRIPLP
nr:MAG TPA: hypothetical protein [Caudoviricetes sp.]